MIYFPELNAALISLAVSQLIKFKVPFHIEMMLLKKIKAKRLLSSFL
jgi:hypothetical protein